MKLFKKHGKVNSFLRSRPKVYDLSRQINHSLFGSSSQDHKILSRVSRYFKGQVNFVQIGANDGLINDPMRDFIVWHGWKGVLIEPLPFSFEKLKKNYSYLNRNDLFFENAAVGSGDQKSLEFWSYNEAFLNGLKGKEERDMFRRKSSFDRDHVISFLPKGMDAEKQLECIEIPIISVKDTLKKHNLDAEINLLTVDAEGYDQQIIESTLKDGIRPDVIFFESDHFDGKPFIEKLKSEGYSSKAYKTDTIAVLEKHRAILG